MKTGLQKRSSLTKEKFFFQEYRVRVVQLPDVPNGTESGKDLSQSKTEQPNKHLIEAGWSF